VLPDVNPPSFVHQGLGPFLVKVRCFSDLYAQRPRGADRDAETSPITEGLIYDTGFAIDQFNGPFRARCDTDAAAVTQFVVYFYDLTVRHFPSQVDVFSPLL
jgi:hypothetical protein